MYILKPTAGGPPLEGCFEAWGVGAYKIWPPMEELRNFMVEEEIDHGVLLSLPREELQRLFQREPFKMTYGRAAMLHGALRQRCTESVDSSRVLREQTSPS